MVKRIILSCFVMGALFCSDREEVQESVAHLQSVRENEACELQPSPLPPEQSRQEIRLFVVMGTHFFSDLEEAKNYAARLQGVRENKACELQPSPLPPEQSRLLLSLFTQRNAKNILQGEIASFNPYADDAGIKVIKIEEFTS